MTRYVWFRKDGSNTRNAYKGNWAQDLGLQENP